MSIGYFCFCLEKHLKKKNDIPSKDTYIQKLKHNRVWLTTRNCNMLEDTVKKSVATDKGAQRLRA